MTIENKEVVRSMRLNMEEDEILKAEANLAGLSISDYMRVRVLYAVDEDRIERKNPTEKLMAQVLVRAYSLIDHIAQKTIDQQTRMDAEEQAVKVLKKFGYE